MKKRFRVAMLLGSCAMICAGDTAFAQSPMPDDTTQASDGGLADIIVTARKRSESLQNVPVAVAAIAGEALTSNMATDLAKIGELAPQVMIGRQTNGTGAILTIRGISSTATDAALDQSVAVNLDGIVLSRGRIISQAAFDLSRVEVMEGPQSLFFGKNSPAGVISLISRDPEKQFEGHIRVGYEFEAKERYVEGAVSLPITSNFRARIAVRLAEMDGWIRNVATPVPDPLHPGVIAPGALHGKTGPAGTDYAGRVTLLFDPGDDFTANLKVTWGQHRLNAMNGYVENFCINGVTQIRLFGTGAVDPLMDCKADQRKSDSALPAVYAQNYPYGNGGVPYVSSDTVLAALNLDKSFGDVTVSSTTGLYHQKYSGTNNSDYTSWALIWDSQFENYDLFTQELRINTDFDSPFNVMVGAYYEHSKRDWGNFPDLFHAGLNVAANNWTTVETYAHGTSDSYSAFAQLRWKLTPTLELTAGARYSKDYKRQNLVNGTVGVSTLSFRPAGSVLVSTFEDDNISPDVTLSWHPGRDQMIYAAYKTGYKAGGLSNSALLLSSATAASLRFGSETTKGFEVGFKGEALNNRARFDIVAYRYDYDGLQLGTFDSNTISFTIGNVARARTEGVQGSFKALVTDRLTLDGNIGYNKARFLKYQNSQCYSGQTAATGCVGGVQDLSGKPLVRAPKVTFTVGGAYEAPVSDDWKALLSVSGSYSGEYQTASDYAPGGIQDDYWRLNASIQLSRQDDALRFSVVGRNLTNSYYMISSVNRPAGGVNEYTGVFNRPREIALQTEFRF